MQKIAIIDLGTNTFNLLVAQKEDETFNVLHTSKQEVKLGKGGISKNEISPEAFQRGMLALEKHLQKITSEKCTVVKAFATSAIRSASNGSEFVQAVKEKLGINIEVIDGLREAELIYKGVKSCIFLDSTSLIMDIGGGSTEFIIGNQKEIIWSKSYNLGVSRLLENFNPSDPILPNQINEIEYFLFKKLYELFEACKAHKPHQLIGSSGSFETFASMLNFPEDIQNGHVYNLEKLKALNESLLKSTLAERLSTPGMIPTRADMIVLSSILVQLVLNNTGISKLMLSTAALKEGVLSEIT
ncbi:MAG: hypothetical protein ACK4K0_04960 [Flavobacteriales bacterium]